jgi:pseudouridine kinase
LDTFLPRDGHVLVIGASGSDIVGRASAPIQSGTSNPGAVHISYGGVAHNVAKNLAHLGLDTVLITAVGDDPAGAALLNELRADRVNVEYSIVAKGGRTGAYVAALDQHGNLHFGLDDMHVISKIAPQHLRSCYPLFKEAAAVVIDANLSPESIRSAITHSRRAGTPIAADPTSVSLASRLKTHLPSLWMVMPNEAEAAMFCPDPVPHADRERALEAANYLVSQGVNIAIITMAEFGVVYASNETFGHVPAIKTEILDPTGAGDAMTAALLFGLLNEIPLDESVRLGVAAASLTLRSLGSTVPDLSLESLYDQLL